MNKINKIIRILIFTTLLFITIYSLLFITAKLSKKIDIKNSNKIYIYDKDNVSFYENNNGKNNWVSIKDISKNLINATIYSEDKKFYYHNGFDYIRIAKSIFTNIKNKDLKEGASTITQQYARNLFLTFEKTWKRKIKEAWIAFKLEVNNSKNEILEGYLNTINYGDGILGIENASLYYFNKHAKDLNLEESTILAGIPKSPNNFSPITNYKASKKRQKQVLNALYKNKIINKKTLKKTFSSKLSFYGKKNNLDLKTLMYYQDSVINELKELKIINEDDIRQKGLKIYTELDTKAQQILETSIKNNIDSKSEIQASSIMVNPKNGAIIALVGGKNYSSSQYNRVKSSKRQVGSTMKPILYYAALENNLTAASTFLSKPTTFSLDNNNKYSPKNYGNLYPNNKITMALAISYSDNIYAIKTHLFLGENVLIDYSKKLGIKSKLEPNASLPLGTNEISITEFSEAFTTFANSGKKSKLHLIKKVVDSNGKILYKHKNDNKIILNKSYTYILNEMLSNTYDSSLISYTKPTCLSIAPKLTKKYAVKSGTTDYDLWTVGYNPDILVSVWTGYDDNRELTSKEYKYSKIIWAEAIENYLRDKKESWYEKPDNVVGVITDLSTGKIADNNSKLKKVLYYIKGTEPGYKNKKSK